MRTVPALILGAAALLQFFSDFASAATCDSVSHVCVTTSWVRDPSKDAEICTSDPTLCDDADCCMLGTVTCGDGYLCTDQGNVLNGANSAVICTNDCDDSQCCTPGSKTCATDPHTCTGLGMADDAAKNGVLCTNDICTDFQCCSVNTRCEHYAACALTSMVIDPLKAQEVCTDSTGAGAGTFCDDDLCCKTTCASGNHACSTGVRNDDATCAVGGCHDDECCTTPLQCSVELHQCPTGYHRVGANMCTGTGMCTDADCCEADLVSTITAARQKKTPRSRQHLTQYGTK